MPATPNDILTFWTNAGPAKWYSAKAAPKKTCYTATPSGSRMPRKVCVTQAPTGDDKAAEKSSKPE